MKKRKAAPIFLLLVCCVCLLSLLLLLLLHKPRTPVRHGTVEQLNQTIAQIENQLAEMEWPVDSIGAEMLIPTEWQDAQRNTVIVLYNYRFKGLQETGDGDHPFLFETVPNPALAEDRQECWVGEHPATHYRSGEWAYLLWQPGEDLILVLAYDPAVLPREEIFKIAESCRPV